MVQTSSLLAICRPSDRTVASGIVVVVVSVCNRSQMRTSKCTCPIFTVSIGLDSGYKHTKGLIDISLTISGWLLVLTAVFQVILV